MVLQSPIIANISSRSSLKPRGHKKSTHGCVYPPPLFIPHSVKLPVVIWSPITAKPMKNTWLLPQKADTICGIGYTKLSRSNHHWILDFVSVIFICIYLILNIQWSIYQCKWLYKVIIWVKKTWKYVFIVSLT